MIRCIRILDTEEDTKCPCRRTSPRTSAGAPAAVARLQTQAIPVRVVFSNRKIK